MGHTIESIWIQRPRSEGYLASSTIADIALKSKQWGVFAMAYAVVFLLPTFDVFPWSYGRLAALAALGTRSFAHQKAQRLAG